MDNQPKRTRPVIPRRRRTTFFIFPNTSSTNYSPSPAPVLVLLPHDLMVRPFDQVSDRHPTPPLSPSTSSGSSRGSSAPSLSPAPLPSLLPRDIDIDIDDSHPHPGCPDPQPLPSKHRVPSTELGLMPHSHDDDAMMLDDWEEVEHERLERDPGKRIQEETQTVFKFLFHSSVWV